MVALIPTVEDAERLAVEGGDPSDRLHLTLAYLGEDVTGWDPELVDAVHAVARELTDPGSRPDGDGPVPDAPGVRPVTLTVFAHSRFNPNGGPDDREPCMVYQFDGDGDLGMVEELQAEVCHRLRSTLGEVNFPEQHARFAPHVTAGYNLPPDALSYTGPVVFDRLRVSLGGETTDYPLGGDSMKNGSVTASVSSPAPPIDWFRNPELPEPTPLTVGDDGRVCGHLALWASMHIGFPDQHISPPRSHTDYAYFHTGSRAVADSGQQRLIPTGHITLDTGHAAMTADYRSAAAHYDDTGTLVADVCAGEDAHGIWVAGATAPGLDELRLHKLRACGLSGDWRRIGAGLELVAALSVPTPGFPVPQSRVASGEPVALVAAGALPAPVAPIDYDALADAVAERVVQRQAVTAALATQRDALVADLDDDEDRMIELLVELYGDELDCLECSESEITADAMPVSRMPLQLQKSYLAGKVAARIRWNTPGDWGRCKKQALKHGMTPHQAEGACQRLHKLATGVYTGDRRNV